MSVLRHSVRQLLPPTVEAFLTLSACTLISFDAADSAARLLIVCSCDCAELLLLHPARLSDSIAVDTALIQEETTAAF